jgi:epoxyqueuosine reductase
MAVWSNLKLNGSGIAYLTFSANCLNHKEVYHKEQIRKRAAECGFELCGFASAQPSPDAAIYKRWTSAGYAGEMRYLTDHRAGIREDPRRLLASVESIICLGKVYNWPAPHTLEFTDDARAWISRYAWGDDYHEVLRDGMKRLVATLPSGFDYKICVDTAPLLERSYARLAGLGWIGRNTCLINQALGSWIFLGEILTSLELAPDGPPPDRCGTCRRCIDACPTEAIVPSGADFTIDSRLCISYLTIEYRGEIPETRREGNGVHIFGCDICQDACPWNRKAAIATDPHFAPRHASPELERLAGLSEAQFRDLFRGTPITRARYTGFLRNVAIAMGNSGNPKLRAPLEKLAASDDQTVASHARWALTRLNTLA